MFNFDENRVRTEHTNGVNLIPEVEKIVDKICEEGYKNIFFYDKIGFTFYSGDNLIDTTRQ